jgi:hypothetical protein
VVKVNLALSSSGAKPCPTVLRFLRSLSVNGWGQFLGPYADVSAQAGLEPHGDWSRRAKFWTFGMHEFHGCIFTIFNPFFFISDFDSPSPSPRSDLHRRSIENT